MEAAKNASPIYAQELSGYWSDVGNPRQYAETVKHVFEGHLPNLELPENPERYYDKETGAIYWPTHDGGTTRALAERQGARLKGPVIVAEKPSKPA